MQEYDIIVIGGGIAGLSAALTAARMGRSTAIVTGGVPGGELLNIEKIDGIPGHEDGIPGYDFCPISQELADAAGAEFYMDEAEAITADGDRWAVATPSGDLSGKAVILATGAHIAKLGVPGEEKFTGRGVSHCATCDGPLLRGKVALVAGGGDSGMQEALTLAAHVARAVIVTKGNALSGQTPYVEAVQAQPNIEVITGTEVVAIEGADKVEKVALKNLATGETSELEAQGVFSFVGLVPNSQLAEGLADLDAAGRVKVDGAMRTSAKGIFAAGNLRSGNGWRAAGAMGDGASAAVAASTYLDSGAWVA
jgi:thioredoxin reductase (NADPH)